MLEFLEQADELLPAPLVPVFDATFVRSCLLYDEFTYRLALGVFHETGLEEAAREPATIDDLIARAGLDPLAAPIPLGWIVRQLAARGALEVLGPTGRAIETLGPARGAIETLGPASGAPGEPARIRLHAPLSLPDPSELERAQRDVDPSWMVSYEIAKVSARGYPEFLRGRRSGEEILFGIEHLGLWFEYFSNRNGLYVVNNLVGAYAACEGLRDKRSLRILELGGGLGSAAIALLERLEGEGRLGEVSRYHFTEITPAFLRRGQRALDERFGRARFVTVARVDMDRPFAEQGIEDGSFSLVYLVNTLHVARDLAFTLGQIRRALEPGGLIVISECIRPFPGSVIYAEFVFNLMRAFRDPLLDPRFRPNGGFLTPEQWSAALEAAGFTRPRIVPDIPTIRERYAAFYVAAAAASRLD